MEAEIVAYGFGEFPCRRRLVEELAKVISLWFIRFVCLVVFCNFIYLIRRLLWFCLLSLKFLIGKDMLFKAIICEQSSQRC